MTVLTKMKVTLRGRIWLFGVNLEEPCNSQGRKDRYKVGGVWLSFECGVEGQGRLLPCQKSQRPRSHCPHCIDWEVGSRGDLTFRYGNDG
jgi:hypothetical protein